MWTVFYTGPGGHHTAVQDEEEEKKKDAEEKEITAFQDGPTFGEFHYQPLRFSKERHTRLFKLSHCLEVSRKEDFGISPGRCAFSRCEPADMWFAEARELEEAEEEALERTPHQLKLWVLAAAVCAGLCRLLGEPALQVVEESAPHRLTASWHEEEISCAWGASTEESSRTLTLYPRILLSLPCVQSVTPNV